MAKVEKSKELRVEKPKDAEAEVAETTTWEDDNVKGDGLEDDVVPPIPAPPDDET